MLRVLHVVSWFGPPFDGARINRYHLLRRLGSRHRQYFVCLDDPPAEADEQTFRELGVAYDEFVAIHHPPWNNWGRFRALFSSLPPGHAFMRRVCGTPLAAAISRAVRNWSADVMVVWSPNLGGICRPLASIPAVLYACDCMRLLNLSIARQDPRWYSRWYHRLAAVRYERYERTAHPLYDYVVFVGERDRAACGLPDSVRTAVVPNGVDTDSLRPGAASMGAADKPVVAFHGYLGNVANSDAVRWLIRELGPALETACGPAGFELRILGGSATPEIMSLSYGKPWVRMAGYVEDLAAALAQATCYAAPLAMGGGIKNKTMEAMACGLPVVGTPEAFSAMDVVSGHHCVSAPRAAMADHIVALLRDATARLRIGRAAREWVLMNSSWDRAAEQMADVIERTAATGCSRPHLNSTSAWATL